jgi:EpsI family protein
LVVAALSMAAVSWAGFAARPHTLLVDVEARAALDNAFPERIGDWRLVTDQVNVPLSPDVAAQVERIYTQVYDRTYVNSKGERIFLMVAYGKDQSDGFKVHRPEVCYAAQGYTVSEPRADGLSILGHDVPVRRVDTSLPGRDEPVTYWMVIGDKPVIQPLRHKVYQIEYAFKGLIADGLLVRVSTIARPTAESYRVQDEFIRQWSQLVPAAQKPRLFGA